VAAPKPGSLLDAYSKALKQGVDPSWFEAQVKKELGADFEKTLTHAQRAVQKFGGEALATRLRETGMGDLPELVRAFAAIGKAMAEDTVAGGVSNGSASDSSEAWLRKTYPSMYPHP